MFEKLANYTGRSLVNMIAPVSSESNEPSKVKHAENERKVFRLHGTRVYYLPLFLANLATSVARSSLLSVGTCVGKFSKTGKFRMHITALDVIAPHARYKLWIKKNGEMPFLYGGNIVKAHVGKWSEDCPAHQGIIVFSMDDKPLVSALLDLRLNVMQVLIHRDVGIWGHRKEYSRSEEIGTNCDHLLQTSRYWRVS